LSKTRREGRGGGGERVLQGKARETWRVNRRGTRGEL